MPPSPPIGAIVRIAVIGSLVIVALVVLTTQLLVAEPEPTPPQPTPPPTQPRAVQPGPQPAANPDAASIRIAAPDVPNGEVDVRLPVNLRIDPDAGIDENASLHLVIDVTVDAQPLAGAAVTVTAASAAVVDTDRQGRLRLRPQQLASWRQLTSAAGVDLFMAFDPPAGVINVALQLVADDGDPPAVLSPLTSRTFDVDADGQSLLARIERDYRAGELPADAAARHSLLSAIDPDYRADRYLELYDDDIPEDPQALGLFAVSLFPEASEETRAELDAYLTGGLRPAAAVSEAAARPVMTTVAFEPEDYSDCDDPGAAWPCSTHINEETGGDAIDLRFVYAVGELPGEVEDRDDDGNGRPDQVDDLVTAFVEAWRFHRDVLGMRAPRGEVTVVLDDITGGVSLPSLLGGSIRIPPDATPYLVRHELFHQVEYRYLSVADIAARFAPMLWLMEATAEWASYEAEQQLGPHDEDSDAGAYAAHLPAALREPHRTIDAIRQLRGGPRYGAFVLLEYLDQEHGGYRAVEDVLIASGDGGRRPIHVIADQVPSWADAVTEYRQWTYVLNHDDRHEVGFAAPDSDGDGIDDIDQHWRPPLQEVPETAGDTRWQARPARVEQRDRSSTPRFSIVSSTTIHPGGAAYVEVELPRGTPVADIDIETRSDDIRVVTMPTSIHPRLCQAPTSVHISAPGAAADAPLHRTCRRLVLALVNTAVPDIGRGGQEVRWTIRVGQVQAPAKAARPSIDPAQDLVSNRVTFGDTVELAARVARPTAPDTWPDGGSVQWRVQLRRDDEVGYANVLLWRLSGVVEASVLSDRGHVSCTSVGGSGEYAFDGTWYRVTFAPECLQMDGLSGPPTELRVAAFTGHPRRYLDAIPGAYADDEATLNGPIAAGGRATFNDDVPP